MSKEVQIIISGKDLASGVIANLTGNLEIAESKAEKFGNRLTTVGGHLAGLSLTIATAGGAAVKMAADMEVTETAFTTLLGSADAAKKHLEDLKKFAVSTPFQFTELTVASRRMMALGFSANQVVPILRILGDATSALGLGAEGLDRVIFSLGQMKAKGVAQADEMRELAKAGIPVWDMLAKAIGKTVPEAMKMAEDKVISSSTAISAILTGLANDPKFAGGMEKQMSTLAGIWSNFKDTLSFTLADIGGLIVQTFDLKDKLKGFTQDLQGFSDWFKNLNPTVRAAIVDVGLFTAILGPFLIIIGKVAQGWSSIIFLLKTLSSLGIVTTITNYTNALSAAAAGNTAAASSITFMNNAMLGSLITATSLTAVLLSLKVAYDSFQDLNLHTSKVSDFSKITDLGQATKIKSDLEREIKRLKDARNKSFSWDTEGIKLYNQEIEDLTNKLNTINNVITKLQNPSSTALGASKINCPVCNSPLKNGKCTNPQCILNSKSTPLPGETKKITAEESGLMNPEAQGQVDALIRVWGDYQKQIEKTVDVEKAFDDIINQVTADCDETTAALQRLAEADEEINRMEGIISFDEWIKKTTADIDAESAALQKLADAQAEIDTNFKDTGYTEAENARKMNVEALKEGEKLAESYSDSWSNAMFETLREWDNTSRQMMDVADSTARGMQQSFSDFFFDAFTNQLKSINDYWLQFRNSFLRSISDMVSQQLTKKIMEGSGLGDVLNGLVGQIFGKGSTNNSTSSPTSDTTQQESGGLTKGLQGILNSKLGKFGLGALMGGGSMGSILGSGLGLLFPGLGPLGGGLIGGLIDSLFGGNQLQKITVQANAMNATIDFAEANFKRIDKLPVSYAGKGIPDFNATASVYNLNVNIEAKGSIIAQRDLNETVKSAANDAIAESKKKDAKWQTVKIKTVEAY